MRSVTFLLFFILLASTSACDDSQETSTSTPPAPTGHSITLQAQFVTDDQGQLPFMTPGATAVRFDPSELIGKPYYLAVFDAGFAPGVDVPRHYTWGTIGEDLAVEWTSGADLEDGPYDLGFIIYRVTEIPEDIMGTTDALVPVNGDLATFTISEEELRENDPPLTAGTLRINIEGSNVVKQTENKWTDDLSDIEAGTKAFTDTILFVP